MPLLVLTFGLIIARGAALEAPPGLGAVLPSAGDHQADDFGPTVLVIDTQGHALSDPSALADGTDAVWVALPGLGRRRAVVVRRGADDGPILLRLELGDGERVEPAPLADPGHLPIGAPVWTAGNGFGHLASDGVAPLSRGVLAARSRRQPGDEPTRGRGGRIVSRYVGPLLETDAAINDGDEGGALLDANGRVVGLLSLSWHDHRRLGAAIPIDHALSLVGLPPPTIPASTATHPLAHAIHDLRRSQVLVQLHRPRGLGNPGGPPPPRVTGDQVPAFQRARIERAWEQWFHRRQVFYTDQPVPALCVEPARGLLLTAASNLHGGAVAGTVLLGGGMPCRVHAIDHGSDLAILACDGPLDLPAVTWATRMPAIGSDLAVVAPIAEDGLLLTTGVVSAVDRRRTQAWLPLVQTDALASYASLGGCAVDAEGAVVGMVVMLGPRDEWPWLINSGVAVLIGAPSIQQVLPELLRGTSISAGRMVGLGVMLANRDDGLYLERIYPGTGAAKAGLRPGDHLLAADGRPLDGPADLSRVLIRKRPDDRVVLTVERDGSQITIPVVVGVFDAG